MKAVNKLIPLTICTALLAALPLQPAVAKPSTAKTVKKLVKMVNKQDKLVKKQSKLIKKLQGQVGSLGGLGEQRSKSDSGAKGDPGAQGDPGTDGVFDESNFNPLFDQRLSSNVAASGLGTAGAANKLVRTGPSGVFPFAALGLSIVSADPQNLDIGGTTSSYCPEGGYAVSYTLSTDIGANISIVNSRPVGSQTFGSGWSVKSSTTSSNQATIRAVCLMTDLDG